MYSSRKDKDEPHELTFVIPIFEPLPTQYYLHVVSGPSFLLYSYCYFVVYFFFFLFFFYCIRQRLQTAGWARRRCCRCRSST